MSNINNHQPVFQQGNSQPVGNIKPNNGIKQLPHNSLSQLDIHERTGGREIETAFHPSNWMEVRIDVDYKVQNATNFCFKPIPLENAFEDFFSLVETRGMVDGYVNISHGSKVEERSGSEVERNSYYYQDKSDGTVMTIEGEDITAETIRDNSDKFIEQLHNNNLL